MGHTRFADMFCSVCGAAMPPTRARPSSSQLSAAGEGHAPILRTLKSVPPLSFLDLPLPLRCLSLAFRCISLAFRCLSLTFRCLSTAFPWPSTEILKSKHVTAGGRWAPTAPVGAHAAGWGTVPPNGLGEAAGPRYSTIAGRPLPDNRIGKPPLLRHWRLCGECVSELLFRCRGDGLVLTAHESGHDWLAAPSQGVGSSRSSPGLRTT